MPLWKANASWLSPRSSRRRARSRQVSPGHPSPVEAPGAVNRSTDYESQKIVDFGPTRSKHGFMAAATNHVSSSLEKVLEHRFVAEITRILWMRGVRDFEILRAEVDAHGYDIVIDAGSTLRHIQLKAMIAGGARGDVGVNIRPATKPSGCVVWMNYDPATLMIGPFMWFGGPPGEPLPDLGDRVARHSKGNVLGLKLVRAQHRLVAGTRFEKIGSFELLVDRLFGAGEGDDELRTLRCHLAAQPPAVEGPEWLHRAARGEFEAVPRDLEWDSAIEFAHLVDGYRFIQENGMGDPYEFADLRLRDAERNGTWSGSASELWVCLFLEYRRWRFANAEPASRARSLLDGLCCQLREALLRAS